MANLSEVYKNLHNPKKPINEAIVRVKFQDEKEAKTLRMSDVYARRILGFAGRLMNQLEDRVEKWIQSGKWSDQAQEYLKPAILRSLQDSYDMDDAQITQEIVNAIDAFISFKPSLNNFTNFISDSSNANFLSFFAEATTMIPALKIFNNPKFINNLIRFEFSESKVAVGPGEVFVTLFSEVVNPNTGDLFVPGMDVEVELKAQGGRAGGVLQAANKAFKQINKALGEMIDTRKDEKLEELFTMVEPFRNIKLANDRFNFNKIINMLLQKDIKNISNLKYLTRPSELETMAQYGERIYSEQLADPQLPYKIMQKLQELGDIRTGGEARIFTTFFNIASSQEKIDMFQTFSPSNKDLTSALLPYLNTLQPDQILAGIQINDYQQKEKFDYILYFDNKSNIASANIKCKIIGPFTDDYNINLQMVLNQANDFKVSVSGGGRGGAQVYI